MKTNFVFFLIVITLFISCKKATFSDGNSEYEIGVKKEIFNSSLKREILKMIQIKKESKGRTHDRDIKCTVVISSNFFEGNNINNIIDRCNVIITFTKDIDPNKITGYTYLDDELIVCYLLSDSCCSIVDKNNLIQFKDSIPGFSDELQQANSGENYDAPMKLFEIINSDSILLLKSLYIPD